MPRLWLGLMTDSGQEPPAAAGYHRVALDLPVLAEYWNPEPIVFCPAILPWPILTQAGLFDAASFGVPLITTPLAPPPFTTRQPLAVDETEEALIPTGWLYFYFVKARTPRPYGRYRYGTQAYGRWPNDAVVQFRMGARLLADKLPAPCGDWGDIAADCAAWGPIAAACAGWGSIPVDCSTWNTVPAPAADWPAVPTWVGRDCE